ncbi:MAG: 23S rRNA (uracil(1939)-C(5))-methyltransferase RlmD [Clostridia bacterium]|nr:23S rRNA (uracil(1939)-C(5))-methyltransferase RlmD [Clostridia bacterium]
MSKKKKILNDSLIKKNDIIDLTIEGFSGEGSGIGRHEGMAIFVPLTAIGDKIKCRILKVAKNYAFGKIEELVEPSSMRTDSDCPYFEKCGGCVYRHISYEEEQKIKFDKVKDCIERIGGLKDIPFEPIIAAKDRCGYRNKAQIPVGLDKDGKLIMGFYAGHSHRIIDAKHCLLQPEEFGVITDIFREWFENYGDTVYNEETGKGVIRHLYLRRGEETGEIMVCVVINGDRLRDADKLCTILRENVPAMTSFVLNTNKEKTNVILGRKCRTVWGNDTIADELCGLRFNISPLSFYQVNRKQAERLYYKAAEYANLTGREKLMDLYCGAGTIGLSMAKNCEKLIGVEIIDAAIENAKVNAAENGIENAEFICGDAAKAAEVLAKRGEKPDVIVIDPPRKGCAAELIDTIANMAPERVVYVSCDPATLARDLKIFDEKGYKTKKVTPVDLFPGTAHCESVALLER